VAAGVGDPAERGVAVHPGQVGEYRAGEVGSERGEGRVPAGADRDAVAAELLRHAVGRDRLTRDHAREEPSWSRAAPGELGAGAGLLGEVPEDGGQSRGQQDGVPA